MRFSRVCPMIVLLAAVWCGATSAQSDYARELYGNGVHAYNAGRLMQARQHLEAAIAQGRQDPRAYYFLGLTKLQSGDTYGAEADFGTAATLEIQGRGAYDVGMALSRVQGQSRMRLEKVRRETKLAVRSTPRAVPRESGEPVPRIAPSPYDDVPPTIDAPTEVPDDLSLDDPFTDDPEPTQPNADDTNDLFDDDVNLEDDPFATEDAAQSEPAAGDAPSGGASAVLRAIFNAGRKAVPTPQLPNIGGPAPNVVPDGPAVAEPQPAAQDEPGDADLFGAAEDDPFADEGDPFAPEGEADTPAPAAAPAAGDEAASDDAFDFGDAAEDDPFAEEDPFADDES